jgi:hypothetical protein
MFNGLARFEGVATKVDETGNRNNTALEGK